MKTSAFAFIAAVFVTSPLFAAQRVSAPPALPGDLESAWRKINDMECVKNDGMTISGNFRSTVVFRVYDKDDGVTKHRFYLMTKNNEIVHQFEQSFNRNTGEISPDAYVKNIDGNWTLFDWQTERVAGEEAIRTIIGLSWPEFIRCASDR